MKTNIRYCNLISLILIFDMLQIKISNIIQCIYLSKSVNKIKYDKKDLKKILAYFIRNFKD